MGRLLLGWGLLLAFSMDMTEVTVGNLCWKRSGFQSCPVGSHPDDKTPEGVLDLAANLREWVKSEHCVSAHSDGACREHIPVYRCGDYEMGALDGVRTISVGETHNLSQANIGFRCAKSGR